MARSKRSGHPGGLVMELQHRVKRSLKPRLFEDQTKPRSIKAGPGRGLTVLLNRRYNLQIEFGLWETELNPIYRRWISSQSVVYDIGAGDGFTSLLYANLGAYVVAFEPDADAFRIAEENVLLNPPLRGRILLVHEPYRHDESLPEPSFMKIDVDGAEIEVLRELRSTPQTVVVETHSAELESACDALLSTRGYRTRIVPNAWWRRLYPEYRPIEQNRWLLANLNHE